MDVIRVLALVLFITPQIAISNASDRFQVSGVVVGQEDGVIRVEAGKRLYRIPLDALPFEPRIGSQVTFEWSKELMRAMKWFQRKTGTSATTQ